MLRLQFYISSVIVPTNLLLGDYFVRNIVFYSRFQNDTVTVRTRKFMTNRLLQRKQMVRFKLFNFPCVNDGTS